MEEPLTRVELRELEEVRAIFDAGLPSDTRVEMSFRYGYFEERTFKPYTRFYAYIGDTRDKEKLWYCSCRTEDDAVDKVRAWVLGGRFPTWASEE